MKDLPTFDELRAALLQSVTDIGNTFDKPDDDWIPVAWVVINDETKLYALDVPKDLYPAFFRALRKEKPTFVGVVLSVWKGTAAEREAIIPPSEDPNRTEAVLVEVSDGHRYEIWEAPIMRQESAPPKLGEWTEMKPTQTEGPLAGLTTHAFEKAGPLS